MDTAPRWFVKLSLIVGPILMIVLMIWELNDEDNDKRLLIKNSFSDKIAYIGPTRAGQIQLRLAGDKQAYRFYQLKNNDGERAVLSFAAIGDAVAKSANSDEISVFHADTVFKFRVTAPNGDR
ncbi:hypothetical protein [Mucilaginibacter myungsuensis]|uniref:Uncharacterized protein n=1 Tax=Mucilaginibacter myungsuensis TaxID=649104 RepID=A0A929PVS5_9SPHI|nr:hypothetical protein [Mucilaginibacter myungsuensis]MBE9662088.1 hypothetical protein [Mucilaginibacter myungsuensis]MDN3599478.1 hypothetical protein [Mucilaginibacter myungsuensis]